MFLVEDDPRLLEAVTELLAGRGYMVRDSATSSGKLQSWIRFGAVRVNLRKSEVLRNGGRVTLSERERRLLQFLIANRGAVLSRETLLESVWGYRNAPLTRTVDVTILRLRQKIESNPREPQIIVTVPGFGYRFDG